MSCVWSTQLGIIKKYFWITANKLYHVEPNSYNSIVKNRKVTK